MIIEDRTNESVDVSRDREALGAGMAIARSAFEMCRGNAEMTLRVLAAALGTAIARSGAPTEAVLGTVEKQRDAATEFFLEHDNLHRKPSDA